MDDAARHPGSANDERENLSTHPILEADGNNLGNEGKGDYFICLQVYQIKYKFSKCHICESRSATANMVNPAKPEWDGRVDVF